MMQQAVGVTKVRTDLGSVHLQKGQCVDVVIACHNPSRPIGRAVTSVLAGNPQAAVTVVCHNCAAEQVAPALAPSHRQQVRYLEHRDPRPSAAGPFNAGLRQARAPWVAIMGSDDQLSPGAVRSWLALAGATGAQVVLTRLAFGAHGPGVPTPAVRPARLLAAWFLHTPVSTLPAGFRRQAAGRGRIFAMHLAQADFAADRLAYRSAPLGLLDTNFLRTHHIELAEGMRVGEDVQMTLQLYTRARTVYDATGPAYLIGQDADDRVTLQPRPLRAELEFLQQILQAPPLNLSAEQRFAFAVKALRIHIFGAIHYRQEPEKWTAAERADLAQICTQLLAYAPQLATALSIAEAQLLEACLHPDIAAAELIARAQARRRHACPRAWLSQPLTHCFNRQAPLRLMGASVWNLAIAHSKRART